MHQPSRKRWNLAAAGALLALFVAGRVALLTTSYDANSNWEEPVFLFSASELAQDGLRYIFDHQDDLNHGGSIVLLILAVPWIALAGTSLVALKGLAILWSGLTLCAIVFVGWRYFSPAVGLLWGLFFTTLSPTAARLNVTLVGSHPEAVLPALLAMGSYLQWVEKRQHGGAENHRDAFLLGFWAGFSTWMAYLSAMFVVPFLGFRLIFTRRRWTLAALGAGLCLGFAPWLYQNLWLRPHGALLWQRHLATGRDLTSLPERWSSALTESARSFGYGKPGNMILLLICCIAVLLVCIGLAWRPWRRRLPANPLALLPLVVSAGLGVALVANATLPFYPNEGYYHYRFFVPLQVALFGILAMAIGLMPGRLGRWVTVVAAALAIAAGVWTQAPLFGTGNHYEPAFTRDRDEGCKVYGLAEWGRTPDPSAAILRLARLPDDSCKRRAFGGFGWGLYSRFRASDDLDRALATLAMIREPRLRVAACNSFRFFLSRASEASITIERRRQAIRGISSLCATVRRS